MKAAGLEEDYAVIRQVIRNGKVSVNDQVTLKQRSELKIGDTVQYDSKHVKILESDPVKEEKEKPSSQNKYESHERPIRHGRTKNWSTRPLKEEQQIDAQIRQIGIQLHKTLISKKLTLSLAESCTGGMAQEYITSNPGASEYFFGGVISYSDEMKKKWLSVKKETLQKHGSVSMQVAIEMTSGIQKQSHSDIAGSITGVAGPDGGTAEKPVGCVFISINFLQKNATKKFLFSGNRDMIRKKSVLELFKLIVEII